MILLGFLLMVASSSTSLVPPCLTGPLIDKVLSPAEHGENISIYLAMPYLLGFLLALILAWLLAGLELLCLPE